MPKLQLNKLVVVLFLWIPALNLAQIDREIYARLISAGSGIPVPYASIQFENSNHGVISNEDGSFRIPYSFREDGVELVISCIGYKTITVSASSLLGDEINLIELPVEIQVLDEIIVSAGNYDKNNPIYKYRNYTAEEIMRKALAQLPWQLDYNYFSYVGYYRDYQLYEDTFYNLNEAIVEVYDQGSLSNKLEDPLNKTRLYYYGESDVYPRYDQFVMPYDTAAKMIQGVEVPDWGNELTLLKYHDPLRNYNIKTFSWVDTLKDDFLINHFFERGAVRYFEGDPLIEVSLKSYFNEHAINYIAHGTVVISLKDFAIHKFNYRVYERAVTEPLYSINLEYKKNGTKMYLNYISLSNKFWSVKEVPLEPQQLSYNAKTNKFVIRFNKDIDPKSVKPNRFKVYYKRRKIIIEDVQVIDDNKVQLSLKRFLMDDKDLESLSSQDLDLVIRAVKDKNGVRIYEPGGYVLVRQFRELFVNEINKDADPIQEGYFVNEWLPLAEIKPSESEKGRAFWFNSPLKRDVSE